MDVHCLFGFILQQQSGSAVQAAAKADSLKYFCWLILD